MFVLTKLILTIRVDQVFSLKQKRSIIKKMKTHVLNTYNACIAESHQQDSLRYLGITIGILSNKKNGLQSLLEKLMEEIEIISEGIIEKKEIDNI
ncbi:MAG: hypothetical protein PWQ84_100 [Thermotogaceae bacterium]|jgi:hypothetical protein|nr:hypothetical protein [Thermotogaceae bacterium]